MERLLEQRGYKELDRYLENQRLLILGAFEAGFASHDGLDYAQICEKYRGKLEMIKNIRSWIASTIAQGKKYAKEKSKTTKKSR